MSEPDWGCWSLSDGKDWDELEEWRSGNNPKIKSNLTFKIYFCIDSNYRQTKIIIKRLKKILAMCIIMISNQFNIKMKFHLEVFV